MSFKKQRNKHKNKPTKRKMLRMKRVLGKAFGIDNSELEEIPHMRNYYKKGFREELKERRAAAKKKKEEQDKEDDE